MVKEITSAEFDNEVLRSEVPVLVDFFATWCGPCKMIAPTLEELSADYEGRAKIVKIDVDQNGELVKRKEYGVRSVPTLIFFKDGKIAETMAGARGKADLAEAFDRLL